MLFSDINPKLVLGIISTILGLAAFAPYILDVLRRKTRPHAYTWLIWCLTQGTAVLALLSGNGGFGGLALAIGTFFVFIVFLLSLRYGTKNITKTDTAVLAAALLAILVWWQLNQPLIAVVMVSAIDVLGYIPTYRKTFEEPWSETVWSWSLFAIANVFALLALTEFNLLTATYLISITVANVLVVLVCLYRRSTVSRLA